MIETVERRARRLFVNGKPVKIWYPHTWFTLSDDEFLEAWQAHLLAIGATGDRIWPGWGPWNRPEDPVYGPAEWRRCRGHVLWCIQNDIVPQVSLIQGTTIDGPNLLPAHKSFMDGILDEIGDIPQVIIETGNEVEKASWHRQAVQYIRGQGLDQLIAVTTGGDGEINALEGVGADILAVTDNYTGTKRLILQMDTDHAPLNSLKGNKIPALEQWVESGSTESGASIAAIMIAWCAPDGRCSKISGFPGKPWNDPNNPHIQPAVEWCQQNIGDQIGGQEPPSPPPPEPPPTEPPIPGPPPSNVQTYDMLNFFRQDRIAPDERLRNVSMSVIGNRIFLVKDAIGSAMDLLVFDDRSIWRISTEHHDHRGDPTAFKGQYGMEPLTEIVCPRYIEFDPDQPPGKLWSQAMPDTTYRLWSNCEPERTGNVGFGLAALWGPYRAGKPGLESWREPIGGVIPDDALCLALAWFWGGPGPTEMPNKEEFINGYGWGPVAWHHYLWGPGGYGEPYRSTLNKNVIRKPKVLPQFPCDERLLDPGYIYPTP